MYCLPNYKTAAQLKRALNTGVTVTVFDPGPLGYGTRNGTCLLEGPHYPQPHTWYANVEVCNGIVVKVLK